MSEIHLELLLEVIPSTAFPPANWESLLAQPLCSTGFFKATFTIFVRSTFFGSVEKTSIAKGTGLYLVLIYKGSPNLKSGKITDVSDLSKNMICVTLLISV